MTYSKLTGNIRYRVHRKIFGPDLVILEVEHAWEDGPDDWHGVPTYLSGRAWRDATPEDLQYINNNKEK